MAQHSRLPTVHSIAPDQPTSINYRIVGLLPQSQIAPPPDGSRGALPLLTTPSIYILLPYQTMTRPSFNPSDSQVSDHFTPFAPLAPTGAPPIDACWPPSPFNDESIPWIATVREGICPLLKNLTTRSPFGLGLGEPNVRLGVTHWAVGAFLLGRR
ncbi:hypothetical protein Salat_2485600 [Sesamum alatum]|uniref:Uncharacterized protein n=1 Tax=Sesamum alatum TaxID=300844 RepID=A0AAE2CC27_9LAMI|nr:hypothetical protein Salat_2485600 [Sesamum alatum]